MNGEYVSMFKINGIPILPPLMTAAKRREMQAYKELAVALEARLKLEAKQKELAAEPDVVSTSPIEDEYLKVSSMLQDHHSPTKLPRQIDKKTGSTESLQKSDTFIFDINTNTVTIPNDTNVVLNATATAGAMSSPQSVRRVSKLSRYVTPSINIKPPTPEGKSGVSNEVKHAGMPKKKIVDSNGPTQRASTSPALKDSPQKPQLIRSNSFTLESPSPVLLQHMVRSRAKNRNSPEDLNVESVRSPPKETCRRARPVVIEACEPDVLNPKQTVACSRPTAHTNNLPNAVPEPTKLNPPATSSPKITTTKKSPYDVKLVAKPKVAKKHKMPLKRISSITLKPRLSATHHHRSRLIIASPSPEKTPAKQGSNRPTPVTSPRRSDNADFLQAKVREIEEQHRLRLMQLMKQQQEEQRLMQEQFERQQKQLLAEFSAGLMSLKALSSSSLNGSASVQKDLASEDNMSNSSKDSERTSIDESHCYDMTSTLASSIVESKNTPRCNRRLFAGCNSAPTPRQRGVPVLSPFAPASAKESRVQSPTTNRKVSFY